MPNHRQINLNLMQHWSQRHIRFFYSHIFLQWAVIKTDAFYRADDLIHLHKWSYSLAAHQRLFYLENNKVCVFKTMVCYVLNCIQFLDLFFQILNFLKFAQHRLSFYEFKWQCLRPFRTIVGPMWRSSKCKSLAQLNSPPVPKLTDNVLPVTGIEPTPMLNDFHINQF